MISSDKLRDAVHKLSEACAKYEHLDDDIDKTLSKIQEIAFDTRSPVREIVAIDGSSAVLWKSPSLPVGLVAARVSMVSRRYDPERIKIAVVNDEFKDFFEVMDENDPAYIRETDEVIEIIDNDDKDQMRSGTPISDKANHFMEKKELETIKRVAETREGIVILKDGPLRLPKAHRMSIIKEILDAATSHDNVVAGISKDSHEKNTSGVDDEIILNIISSARPEITGYYPKHEGNDEFKIGECFARLHRHAMKWFRVDFPYDSPASLGEILRTIACYSQVNTMPGTPFPLMDTAHEIAVKIRQLKPSIESRIMEYLRDEGFSGIDILRGLTDVTGKLITGSHHDFLDNFTRVSN